jgi:hypothetical protein
MNCKVLIYVRFVFRDMFIKMEIVVKLLLILFKIVIYIQMLKNVMNVKLDQFYLKIVKLV